MTGQQTPGPKDSKGVFSLINNCHIIWTGKNGITHACQGADLHPGVRLLWTFCESDVSANGAMLARDASKVDCPLCLKKKGGDP